MSWKRKLPYLVFGNPWSFSRHYLVFTGFGLGESYVLSFLCCYNFVIAPKQSILLDICHVYTLTVDNFMEEDTIPKGKR